MLFLGSDARGLETAHGDGDGMASMVTYAHTSREVLNSGRERVVLVGPQVQSSMSFELGLGGEGRYSIPAFEVGGPRIGLGAWSVCRSNPMWHFSSLLVSIQAPGRTRIVPVRRVFLGKMPQAGRWESGEGHTVTPLSAHHYCGPPD